MLIELILSVFAAVFLFLLCRILPEKVGTFLCDDLLSPLHDTFMGLISFASGPLVLLSVTWGVFSIGDVTSLSTVGKKMIARFLLVTLFCGALVIAVSLPFYGMEMGGKEGFAFSELYGMVLAIIPDNLISPFLDGNTLQIIFIAVIIGIAMLLLSEKTTVAAKFVEQSNYISSLIMQAVSRLIPIFVFMSVFRLLQNDGLTLLAGSMRLIVTMVLSCAAILLVLTTVVSLRFKVRMTTLLWKMMPAFLIALTTASSSAAYHENVETCRSKHGIRPRIVNIGIPLGQTIFMPGAAANFITLSLFMTKLYGVTITPVWLISLLLVCSVLAIAAPPVPGSTLACVTLIVSQMGFPAESISVFCALGIISEFLDTAVSVTALQLQLIELSSEVHMLDVETLRKKM